MTIALKQSTASQEIPLGYFVDSTDGDTAETGLTIANTDIKIWKNGATTLANKNSGGATHIAGGVYYCTLDATDTDTVGPLVIFVHVSGALAVRVECHVYEEVIYDGHYAASATGAFPATLVQGGINTTSGTITTLDGLDTAQDSQHSTTQSAISTAQADLDILTGTDGATLATSQPNYAPATAAALATVDSNVDAILVDTGTTLPGVLGTPTDFGSGTSTLAANLQDLADNGTATYDRSTDSLQAIRDHVGDGSNLTEAGGTGDHLSAIPWNSAWDAEVQSEVTDALNAYDPPTKAELDAGLAALNDITVAEVWAHALTEPSGVPAWSGDVEDALNWLLALARNKMTSSSTTQTLRNDADSANIATSTHSDSAGTFTRGEWS